MEMKQLQLIPQAIVLTFVVAKVAGAETCFPPARPFVPNDSVALAEFSDLVSQDFETYIQDVQAYFRCLDEERDRAFEEAREVSQDYERFLQDRGAGDR